MTQCVEPNEAARELTTEEIDLIAGGSPSTPPVQPPPGSQVRHAVRNLLTSTAAF